MDDLERTFREGLRQAVADRPGGVRVDIDEVIARASSPDFVPESRWTPPRWLAAAAAVLVVAGLGVGLAVLRPSAGVTAVPAAPSSMAPPGSDFDSSTLVGYKWSVKQIGGRSVEADKIPRQAGLSFTSATEVLTDDGCNTGPRTYRFAPRGVLLDFHFGPLGALTEAACSSTQPERFATALDDTTQARLSADLLELLNADQEVVMTLTRAESVSTAQPTRPPTPRPTDPGVRTVEPPSATPTPTEPPVASSSPTAGVHVRIYNDTGVTLHKVKLGFSGGVVISEAIMAPGSHSEYLSPQVAYRIASLEAVAGGHPYLTMPADYVGEQPLEPGNYTYSIRLTEGVMFLEFSQD